jgi:hypothetical protein
MLNGEHRWYTAASGTAGNAITFTQAMTLDASGNLGLGSTSPTNFPNYVCLELKGKTTTYGGVIKFVSNDGTHAALNFLDANGNCMGTQTAHPLRFITNDTERARITSGGDFLLCGKTVVDTTTAGAYFEPNSINYGRLNFIANSTATASTPVSFYYNGSQIGTITGTTTATAYNTSSDRRLKENIAAADDAGSVIDAIQIVKHDWKVGGHVRFGVVAQDLQVVAPEAVSAGDDGEEIERTWGVDYSKLVPMLVKEIQSLRARVAALEGA